MLTAKVFQSGNSQAIRIPKEAQTDQQEFFIRKLGNGFVLFPTDDPWYPLRESIGMIPDDFMEERSQPSWNSIPEREEYDLSS
ncbi:MAG: AbrB/MazE/SpoVT family DNA-binding domain-containing protein [Lachnospiraceae bacterium]|nr:AbrB/MazE/SpoVT family DNA-binding domain-containing protein [Lachnospiraceae bacterium]